MAHPGDLRLAGTAPASKTYSNFSIVNRGDDQRVHVGDNYYLGDAAQQSRDEWRDICIWLFSPDKLFDQTAFNRSAQKSRKEIQTGAWFLDGEDFSRWKSAPAASFLWLNGKLGSGKTVLCSSIVKQLSDLCSTDPQCALAYHYFTFTDQRSQQVDTAIRSLVLQLARRNAETRNILKTTYGACDFGARQAVSEELVDVLWNLVKILDSAFILLDALDECPNREDIFDLLNKIQSWNSSSFHCLITSQSLVEIETRLSGLGFDAVRIDENSVNRDIQQHVKQQLANNVDFARWTEDQKIQIQIKLTENSDGIFRYVAAPLADIAKCRTLQGLLKVLSTLPKSLEESYERILCADREPYAREQLKTLLKWLTTSVRPLRFEELAEVVAIDVRERPYFKVDRRLTQPIEILDLCSTLVTLETESYDDLDRDGPNGSFETDVAETSRQNRNSWGRKTNLKLAHSSVRDYLLGSSIRDGSAKDYYIDATGASVQVAEMCLAYVLYFDMIGEPLCSGDKAWPLLKYAIHNWYYHAEYNGPSIVDKSKLDKMISHIFQTSEEIYRVLTYPQNPKKFNPWLHPNPSDDTDRIIEHWTTNEQVNACSPCQNISLEKLQAGYKLHDSFDKLQSCATRGCQICVLVTEALLYHWMAAHSDIFLMGGFEQEKMLAGWILHDRSGNVPVWLRLEPYGDPFVIVSCSHYFGRLHLFTEKASGTISGRPIRANLRSEETLAQIKSWNLSCQSTHKNCQITDIPILPRFVINIGGSAEQPRLQEGGGHRAIYATLSHIWGKGAWPVTTRRNLLARMEGLELNNYPQLWQDAVTILRALGVEYLWIDAICMIQDSQDDWEENDGQIPIYFKNSFLNIVAGLAHPSEGCLGRRRPPRFLPCKIRERSPVWGPLLKSFLSPAKDHQDGLFLGWLGSEAYYNSVGTDVQQYPDRWRYLSPAHRRAWILQEMRLAPRNLVFQDDEDNLVTAQLYLQCQQMIVWENGRSRQTTASNIPDQATSWYRLVEQYSEQQLTYFPDRLPAIAALARHYKEVFPGSYNAGIWSQDLLRGLLWYRSTPGISMPQVYEYVAPSWSWVCGDGPLKHYWPPNATADAECVDMNVEQSSRDLFGRVKNGWVVLSGDFLPLRPLLSGDELNPSIWEFEIEIENVASVARGHCFLDHEIDLLNNTNLYSLRITNRGALLLQESPYTVGEFLRLGLLVWDRSCIGLLRTGSRGVVKIV